MFPTLIDGYLLTKKIFLLEYFPPFLLRFSSPPEKNVNVNVAVFTPKPRLFFGTKFSETENFFQNRNRAFFSETKFSETETFFSRLIFPKLRLFFRVQILRNRNPNPSKIGKSFETEKFRNRNVNL